MLIITITHLVYFLLTSIWLLPVCANRFLHPLSEVHMEALFKLQHVLDLWGLCWSEFLWRIYLAGKHVDGWRFSFCTLVGNTMIWYSLQVCLPTVVFASFIYMEDVEKMCRNHPNFSIFNPNVEDSGRIYVWPIKTFYYSLLPEKSKH